MSEGYGDITYAIKPPLGTKTLNLTLGKGKPSSDAFTFMKKFLKTTVIIFFISVIGVVGYYFYDTFREKSFDEQLARIIHLEDKRKITSELEDFLNHPIPEFRKRATLAIGRIGTPGVGNALFKMVG